MPNKVLLLMKNISLSLTYNTIAAPVKTLAHITSTHYSGQEAGQA